jgi:uncharacterized protein (DUF2236 family)
MAPAATSVVPLEVVRRVNGERLVVLGWGRAILMQLAHPLVAAGVDAHSTFRATRRARYLRLHQTVQAMLDLTFGDERTAARAAGRINAIHDHVHGRLDRSVGLFRAGTPYSAHQRELLLWVHATLLDSMPLAYEALVAPLEPGARDAYCREAAAGAARLGLPPDTVPQSWSALERYMDGVARSGTLAVGPHARALAREILYPPLAWMSGPIAGFQRDLTIGTLPPALRRAYGFAWTPRDERRLRRRARLVRRLRRLLPAALARWRRAR